ncbi:hypothetical protein CPB84DRAFT_1765295, partial [Gymnopilus junonius]
MRVFKGRKPRGLGSEGATRERSIDRDLLVAVSPDREDFLRTKTILEIREFLKMSPSTSNGHWLYRTQKRRNITIKSNATEGDNDARPSTAINVLPTLSPKSSVIVGVDGTLTTWSSQNLSSTDCLISPRLPGPTHILVVQATHSTITRPVNTVSPSVRQCKASLETMEIPINDLLFVLNVPNLKSIIPEWMRDIMHPLPKTSSGIGAAGLGLDTAGVPPATEPSARAPTAPKRMRVSRRSSLSVASEIALASFELRFNVKDDPLMFTATLLDALRDNLDYIGYYASELWDELLASSI